jgi:Phage stabilisation protein
MTDRALQETTETIRIPFGAEQNQRVQTSRGFSRNYGSHDQSFVNCYPIASKDPFRSDTTKWELVSRYGINNPSTGTISHAFTNESTTYLVTATALTQLPYLTLLGFYDSTSQDVLIYEYDNSDGNLYKVAIITGTFVSPNVYITELDIGGTCGIQVHVQDDTQSEAWGTISAAGTFASAAGWTQITDVDFPSEKANTLVVGPAVQLNSYVFVLGSDNKIYNCSLDVNGDADITTWDTDGNVEVTSQPDGVLRIVRYKHHIVAMGTSSIEFFNFDPSTVAPESPLTSTDQAYIGFGVLGTNSVVSVDDTLYWVSASKDASLGLWRLEGYTPVLVSDNYHNAFLQQSYGDINLYVMQMHGTRHLITNIQTSHNVGYVPWDDTYAPENTYLNGILCYNIDSKAWWLWAFEANDLAGSEIIPVRNVSNNYQLVWVANTTYGHFPCRGTPDNEMARSFAGYDSLRVQDSNTINHFRIPIAFFSNVYDFETSNRKTISRMKIIGDVLHDNNPSYGGNPIFITETLSIYPTWTWNDYAWINPVEWNYVELPWTWPDDLGSEGAGYLYTSLPELTINNLGHARKWKFATFLNSWTPIRWDAIELTIRKGSH